MRWLALIPFALVPALLRAQDIPTRSLLPELAAAEQTGLAASVHTRYALASALLIDHSLVLSARHSVMKPAGGGLAEEIGIGYARPPLANATESRSVAVAEDPAHDLILLRLVDESTAPAAGPEKLPPCKTAAAPKKLVRAARRRRAKPVPVHVARFAHAGAPVKIQVITDGPAARQRTGA